MDKKILEGLGIGSLVLLVLVLGMIFSPILAWGAFIASIVAILLIGHPRVFIYFGLIMVFTRGILLPYFPLLRYLDEFLMVGLLVLIVGEIVLRKEKKGIIGSYAKFLIMLLGWIFLSAAISRSNPTSLFLFIKSYFALPAFFIASIFYLKAEDARRFCFLFFAWMVGQFFLDIFFVTGIFDPPNMRVIPVVDWAQGTFGNALHMAYLSIIALILFVAMMSNKIYFISKGVTLVCGVCIGLNFIITFTAHAYGFLFIIACVFVLSNKISVKELLPLVVFVLLISWGVFAIYQSGMSENIGGVSALDKKSLTRRLDQFKSGPKLKSYENSFVILQRRYPLARVLGVGPGNYMSGAALKKPTSITYEFLSDFYLTMSGSEERLGGSILSNPLIGVGVIVGELGYVGFVGYFLMFFIPCKRVFSFLNRHAYSANPYQKTLAMVYVPFVILFLLINLLMDAFGSILFLYLLGIWTAIIWVPFSEEVECSEIL